jgi:uncharacterized RDD family membrane protein YckC
LKQHAPLTKRFLALWLDYLLILGYMAVLFAVNLLIYLVFLGGIPAYDELGMNLISLTLIVPVILYSILAESGRRHATFGKAKAKLTVVSSAAGPIRLWQIILRNLVKFLPWQLAHIAIFHSMALQWEFSPLWTGVMVCVELLPFLWVGLLFRKDRRGIHDLLAKTRVTERDAHIT